MELTTGDLLNRWLKSMLPAGVVNGTVQPGPQSGSIDYPVGAVPTTASSGNTANAVATATLAGVATKTTYITGFTVSGAGATAGLPVIVTVTGVIGGTMSFIYVFEAGALVGNKPLVVSFETPVPASAVNTAIAVSCPAGGAGNTNNAVVATGYQL